MKLIDTHCHLNFKEHFPNVVSTLQSAKQNNVVACIVVGCDTETSRYAIELAEKYEEIYACIGWHPNYSANYTTHELKKINELSLHPKCVAIGEVGLDYHWKYATLEQQKACTLEHVQLAIEKNLPVVFHCREAYDDLLDFLEDLVTQPKSMILHCFSGNIEHAKQAVSMGCYFGIDGPITYRNAENLRQIAKILPKDRLLVETDSPYLTPHPYRGQQNSPAMIPLINSGLAKTLDIGEQECAEITTGNAMRVFSINT